MADIKDQDLLDEIRFDIKVKDRKKAELVLSALRFVKRDTQKKALFELSRADAEFSIVLFAGLFVNAPDIANAFPQLKETMYGKIISRPDVLRELLRKEANLEIRTFLVQTVGEIQLKDAVPSLLDLLNNDSDSSIVWATIVSLGMLGEPNAVSSIAPFLGHADPTLSYAAIDALGQIDTPEAVQKIANCLGNDPELDQKIIDILSRSRTSEAIEALNDTISSEHAHIRTTGKEKLGAIGVTSVRVLLKNLDKPDPDLVIHSLNVLGDIGDEAAVTAIRNLLNDQPEDANIRFAAYEALGRLPLKKGAYALAAGLEDPVDNVRTAAAKAIDRNYNALLAGGLRNMTKTGDKSAATVILTIINAECERIFMDLLEEDYFKTASLAFLRKNAHPALRAYYAAILSANGRQELAKQVAPKKGVTARTGLRVYAVDDSKMILNIYRTVLHSLGCEAITFQLPMEAVAQVKENRPDVILTDLNMPEITGIDLAAKVREFFSKEELPIIMVTTQQESHDLEKASKAGVNGIIQKPFTESHIGAALKKYAGYKPQKDS